MTHIAFIHKDFPCSGAEQVTIDVANYLCRHNYRVTILAVNHREQAYPAGTERLFSVTTLPQGNMKRSQEVAAAVGNFITVNGVSILVTYRELFYARRLKEQTGVKIVYELHNTPDYEFLDIADKRRENRWKNLFYGCGVESVLRYFYKRKYNRIYKWCDAYGVLCDGYGRQLVDKLRLDARDNKLWVLPNSIAPAGQVPDKKAPVMLYVGRLTHRDKRVDRLLRIWQQVQHQLPDWQLKIVGTGRVAGKLQQTAQRLGLERCSFEGYTTHVANYYDEASILCLTSSFEGWPMCVAEGQARGVVPVLFNSFDGAADLVSASDEGVLVSPFDEQLFGRELVALATDTRRLQQMQAAVSRKAATYTIERSGQAWVNMFNHLLEQRTS